MTKEDKHDWYIKNKQKSVLRAKTWKAKNPEKWALHQWKFNLKKKYKLTVEQYNEMYLAQEKICAICKKAPKTEIRRLAVDHCHKTGKIRGLLCTACNRAIGLLQDDLTILDNAKLYLEKKH